MTTKAQNDHPVEHVRSLMPFPTFGYLDSDGSWRLNVSGVIRHPYAPTLRKRMLIRMLANVMHASEDELNTETFRNRVASFVMDGAHGHQVGCSIGNRNFLLPKKTKRNGHFSGWLALEPAFVQAHSTRDAAKASKISLSINSDRLADADAQAEIHLVPQRGVSVISDIDDTIKESAIGDRRELLANTFLREFRCVSGMSDVYQQWLAQRVAFHYVSSSPWQLLPWITEMMQAWNFPPGSLHLRDFRLRNHMLQRMIRLRRSGKTTAIKLLLMKFPFRKFILVGDSGEKDLEIYRKTAARFPRQVTGILIRDLPHHPIDLEQLEKCRAALPHVMCKGFETAVDLKAIAEPLLLEN